MWPQIIAAVQKVFELGHMLVSDWSKRNLGGTNLMNTDQMLVTRRAVPGILEFVTTHPLCGGGGGSDADLLVVCVTRYHVGVVVDMALGLLSTSPRAWLGTSLLAPYSRGYSRSAQLVDGISCRMLRKAEGVNASSRFSGVVNSVSRATGTKTVLHKVSKRHRPTDLKFLARFTQSFWLSLAEKSFHEPAVSPAFCSEHGGIRSG
ncbi:hypothetical protein F5J12DRAFT_779588 [Pisolithus orientalis]|uniref:uncharacterized protein n=1 Tax=Pisolithus orientalis TaxID=936130 RepID=UPI0022259CFE|nr:uncharacterized protein F5J12DRAFT_779588 [Pisolithus orientalis]KAI6030432.1 hypothetical protein F5J12DRAFT_779588 [Pisolithus orientalis]